jgi:hypothetical protein
MAQAGRLATVAGVSGPASKMAYIAGGVAASAVGVAVYAKTKIAEIGLNRQVSEVLSYVRLGSEMAMKATWTEGTQRAETLRQARRYLDRAGELTRAISNKTKYIQVLKGELDDIRAGVMSGIDLLQQSDVANDQTLKASLFGHASSAFSAGKTASAWSFLARPSPAWKNAVIAGGVTGLGVSGTLLLAQRIRHRKDQKRRGSNNPEEDGSGEQ